MTKVVDWDKWNDEQKAKAASRGGGKDLVFVQMGQRGVGKKYKLRPVGNMVQFYEYVVNHGGKWRSAITADPENCPVTIKRNERAKEVYAVNVIDRADGQVKILKGPVSVFKEFHTFFKHHGKNPGGPSGGDFELSVTGKKGKDYYVMEFLEKTPLSEEEVAMLKGNLFELEKIFKETPDDEIENKLFPSDEEEPVEARESAAAVSDDDDDEIPF